MIEKKEKEINGTTYIVTQLGAGEARKMLLRLAKAVAPLASAGDLSQVQNLGKALSEVLLNLSEEDFDHACRVFGDRTEILIDGKPRLLTKELQENHFAGRMKTQLSWLWFCVQTNYADFLEGFQLGTQPALAEVRRKKVG